MKQNLFFWKKISVFPLLTLPRQCKKVKGPEVIMKIKFKQQNKPV